LHASQLALVLNTAATAGFGLAVNTPMLLVFRFLIGVLQAVPMVYFPVWVHHFAPDGSATLWMACVQGGAPLCVAMPSNADRSHRV
jgi:hypothetical protein